MTHLRESGTIDGAARGPMPLLVTILALEPDPKRTPRWARHLKYSHIVLVQGNLVWDQPIRGKGQAYELESWLEGAGPDRNYMRCNIQVSEYSPLRWRQAVAAISDRRGQPLRTLLRHFRLWPKPAWNCTSPIRTLLAAIDIPCAGETPDDIIKELH